MFSLAFCLPQSVGAQSLVRSPVTVDYLLTYTLGGVTYSGVVESADHIDPRLDAQVTQTGGLLTYQYTIANLATARATREIVFLDVPCPPDPNLGAKGNGIWTGGVWRPEPEHVVICDFGMRGTATSTIPPGQKQAGLVISSTWLPAIGNVRVYGSNAMFAYPTDAEDVPDSLRKLVDSIQGFNSLRGGGVSLPAIVPGRSPSALTNVSTGFALVQGDLSQACSLGWIGSPLLCATWQGSLSRASTQAVGGQTASAKTLLQSLLVDVTAQHTQNSAQVSDNAYSLISTNLQVLLGVL